MAGDAKRHVPEAATVLLILVAASLLLLLKLGDAYLWQDEAQTALVSRTILTHGIPVGYDGRNYFSQELGAEYGRGYVWKWHTWFPLYVLAGFFALFGQSTFVARLPFALFGIGTVLLIYYFGRELWESRRAGVTSAVLLLISVPFLILARQCRYYSPTMFFSVLALFAYYGMLQRRRFSAALFIVSAVLLFNSHYPYYGALLATVIVHSLIFRRDRLKAVLLASAASFVLNLPWIVWLSTMTYGVQHSKDFLDLGIAARISRQLLGQTVRYIFPPLLLALPAAAGIVTWAKSRRLPVPDPTLWAGLAIPVLFTAFTIAAFSFTAPEGFFRYLGPVIPMSCLVMALILESGMKVHVTVGIAVLAIMTVTGNMGSYLYEITHDFEGPVETIVRYLNKHGRDSDVVAITYDDLPVKFYSKMRVIGGLTGEDPTPALKADWVIIRRNPITGADNEFAQYLMSHLLARDYRRIVTSRSDTPFQNRESPDQHLFRTVEGLEPLVIFERKAHEGRSP